MRTSLLIAALLFPAVASAQGLPLPGPGPYVPGPYVPSPTFPSDSWKQDAPKKHVGRPRGKPHPDAGFQRRLRSYTRYLKLIETPGVELWSKVMKLAVNHYGPRDDLSVQQKFDRVMRDTGAVLLGEHPLEQGFEELRKKDDLPIVSINGAQDPLMDWLLRNHRVMDDVFAGKDLDVPEAESDFRAGFHDGTRNQVYHSFFYVQMAYFTGNSFSTSLGNLVHELRDEGGSAADYDVGNWAAQLGEWLRRFRNDGNERALYALPTLFGAMFSETAGDYGDPADNVRGWDFTNLSGTVDRMLSEKLSNPSGGFLGNVKHRIHRGAIGFLSKLRGG